MDADAHRVEVGEGGGLAVELAGTGDGHAELVLAQAGADIRVSSGAYVGIDPESDARGLLQAFGAGSQQLQFGFALHVKEQDFGCDGRVHLRGGFAHAGEDHALRGLFGDAHHALQLAAAHHVKAAAQRGQQAQHGEVRVGLYRIAERVRLLFKGAFVGRHARPDGRGRIHVEGRAKAAGQALDFDLITAQGAAVFAAAKGKSWRTLLDGAFADGHCFLGFHDSGFYHRRLRIVG